MQISVYGCTKENNKRHAPHLQVPPRKQSSLLAPATRFATLHFVSGAGLEPARLAALVPKTSAYTNSATPTYIAQYTRNTTNRYCIFFALFSIYCILFVLPPIAQLVEHSPLKRLVEGSNPSGRTRVKQKNRT